MHPRIPLKSVQNLLCFSSLAISLPAIGHGWITSPPSRQDHCAKGRTSFDCGDIKYEPQSVEGPKGAWQCSGGSRFSILDTNGPWPVTTLGSQTTFTWQLTAPHRTQSWEYFMDGALIQYIDGGHQVPSYSVSHTLSSLPQGYHTIFARWNIADTPMAFYSCIDVFVGG